MLYRILIVALVALAFASARDVALAAPLQQEFLVQVKDNVFEPFTVRIPQGTVVSWSHLGRLQHTVTSDDALFDSGPLNTGATFSVKFNAVGVYGYHCQFHGRPGSGMAATIVVIPAEGEPTSAPLVPAPGEPLPTPEPGKAEQAASQPAASAPVASAPAASEPAPLPEGWPDTLPATGAPAALSAAGPLLGALLVAAGMRLRLRPRRRHPQADGQAAGTGADPNWRR